MTEQVAYNQAARDSHPAGCASLPRFKLFRPGGFCCLSCYDDCTGCGDPFFIEGLTRLGFLGDDEDETVLCDCCLRKHECATDEPREG